jgi:hypothetical protein
MNTKLIKTFIVFIFFLLIGIELFINAPINGRIRYPWTGSKDNTIVVGLILTALLAVLAALYIYPYNIIVVPMAVIVGAVLFKMFCIGGTNFQRDT